jgi:catechol 2,3-dioxygenase
MELFAEKEKVGNGLTDLNPDPWPDGLKGMAPSRFDHCLLYGEDLDGSVKLFTELLGFPLTERVIAGPDKFLISAFMTCSTKPHDVAFIRQPVKNKFHHASFFLDTWGEVLRAADIISKRSVSLDIGPARHGIRRRDDLLLRSERQPQRGLRRRLHRLSGQAGDHLDRGRTRARHFLHDRKLNERFLSVFT